MDTPSEVTFTKGCKMFLMPIFLDGPGLKDSLKRTCKCKVARQFNFFSIPGRGD